MSLRGSTLAASKFDAVELFIYGMDERGPKHNKIMCVHKNRGGELSCLGHVVSVLTARRHF
jgi:hypothetical protein